MPSVNIYRMKETNKTIYKLSFKSTGAKSTNLLPLRITSDSSVAGPSRKLRFPTSLLRNQCPVSPTEEHTLVTTAHAAPHTVREIFPPHIFMTVKHTFHGGTQAVLNHLDTHLFIKPERL